jgi:hypothetical protein
VKKISNAHIFEAAVTRDAVQRRLIDELLGFFGGRIQPVMAHLVESRNSPSTLVHQAEQAASGKRKRMDTQWTFPHGFLYTFRDW